MSLSYLDYGGYSKGIWYVLYGIYGIEATLQGRIAWVDQTLIYKIIERRILENALPKSVTPSKPPVGARWPSSELLPLSLVALLATAAVAMYGRPVSVYIGVERQE
jgi:hypothetical protein